MDGIADSGTGVASTLTLFSDVSLGIFFRISSIFSSKSFALDSILLSSCLNLEFYMVSAALASGLTHLFKMEYMFILCLFLLRCNSHFRWRLLEKCRNRLNLMILSAILRDINIITRIIVACSRL